MGRNFFVNLLILAVLVLVQVLICNHVMLFNIAIGFVFIFVIVNLPMGLNTNYLLTWAFFGGFLVDIFSDTPGVNSLACVILAMLKRPALYAYITKDDRTKNIEPSLSGLGFSVYGKYLFTMSAAYCFLVFSIEYFNFANIREILTMSAGSSLLTFLILLGIDSVAGPRRGT